MAESFQPAIDPPVEPDTVGSSLGPDPDCDACMGLVTLQDALDTPARVSLCPACEAEVEKAREESARG